MDEARQIVIGIDPSLVKTGLCRVVDGVAQMTTLVTTTPDRPRPERLIHLQESVGGFIRRSFGFGAPLGVVERPFVVAMESQIWSTNPDIHSADAAVYGVLQVEIWEIFQKWARTPNIALFVSVNPAHVKKWLGVKDKDQILLQVFKRYGREFPTHDEADAFVVAMIGQSLVRYRQAGALWPEITKPQGEVLDKLLLSGLPWEPQQSKPVKGKKGK